MAGSMLIKRRVRKAYFSVLGVGEKYSKSDVLLLQEQLHQSPRAFGLLSSRWTLQTIRQTCGWLKTYSLSGVWRVLRANGVRYKRGQEHLHSPDLEYVAKRDHISWCVQQARDYPGVVVVLFLDEFSYYRWPGVARAYSEVGVHQPRANLTASYNTRGRLIAALESIHGKVLYLQRSHITVHVLVLFLQLVRRSFPEARTIYIVQDNWHNVHFHPNQIAAAEQLGIVLVPLPTYAPWLNPCEKLGRKLRQDVTHMHNLAQDWEGLKKAVTDFLDQFASGSIDLLKYTGLLPV
jgi:hypothetical protein